MDVLRGFALLGILLLNILGFGLPYAAYSNPGFDLATGSALDIATWSTIELLAEGAMRCLFSILFGAGVVLFASGTNTQRGVLHYKRTFWLLLFGLFDAYVLLWNGDILVTYALAGALLFPLRNLSPRKLLISAAILIALMSLLYGAMGFALRQAFAAAQAIAETTDPDSITSSMRQGAAAWQSFIGDFRPTAVELSRELTQRQDSYVSAFAWNVPVTNQMLLMIVPLFLFWDALAMMMLGMALFKSGILQGDRPTGFYVKLMLAGFAVGLSVNGYEVSRSLASDFDIFSVFSLMQPTYHVGRLGMACGYLGLLVWLTQRTTLAGLQHLLAQVGRMALTNYLMQSLICLFVFTGAGLALVGQWSRSEVYVVVFGIWLVQLWFSSWWLLRFRYGPLEWLWRTLTYGNSQPLRRSA